MRNRPAGVSRPGLPEDRRASCTWARLFGVSGAGYLHPMKLLSTLLRPWRHQSEPWKPGAPERRADKRHEVYIPVSIGPRGRQSIAGTIVNISVRGAAIRLYQPGRGLQASWLDLLNQGDELWLRALLDTPVACWVVVIDDGVLRVYFASDDELRGKLRGMIERLVAEA